MLGVANLDLRSEVVRRTIAQEVATNRETFLGFLNPSGIRRWRSSKKLVELPGAFSASVCEFQPPKAPVSKPASPTTREVGECGHRRPCKAQAHSLVDRADDGFGKDNG